jgi:hypothetical protein
MEGVTKGGTVAIAIPENSFLIELARLNVEDGQLMIGSSGLESLFQIWAL